MQPVIQVGNNVLLVDMGWSVSLSIRALARNSGHLGSFPGLETNLRRAGITPEA